jgi:hypothetical protein
MHCPYHHELTIVADCLSPSLNNSLDGPAIFYIIYPQFSWCPALQDVQIILKQIKC